MQDLESDKEWICSNLGPSSKETVATNWDQRYRVKLSQEFCVLQPPLNIPLPIITHGLRHPAVISGLELFPSYCARQYTEHAV